MTQVNDTATSDTGARQSCSAYLVRAATPEFVLAFFVLVIFAGAYFYDPTPTKEGALLAAFSTAMAYFLGQDRKKGKMKDEDNGSV